MNDLLKFNTRFITYSIIILTVIPIFGIKFFVSFLGNIFLLFILIPLLILLLLFIRFSSYKSKIRTCKKCGSISLGLSDNCMNCGAELEVMNNKNQQYKNPSESTIEIKAEEIK